MEVYLTYDEYSSGGQPEDPSDRWTSYSDTYKTFDLTGAYLDRDHVPNWLIETVTIDTSDVNRGDFIFVTVVRYGSGNTFGRTYGEWHIYGVYTTRDEAEEAKHDIRTDQLPKDTYRPWEGYFERLEDVEVTLLDIQ